MRTNAPAQRGITLLESLIALLILAIAILGMLGVQVRTLAETQTGVRRAQAVRLIEDLAERIRSNPGGYAQFGAYSADWTTTPAAATDCAAAACTPTQLAQWDLRQWKLGVAQALPSGEAFIFESTDESSANRRQLGVMVGWRAKEKDSATEYTAPFVPSHAASDVQCRTGRICHLVYIQP